MFSWAFYSTKNPEEKEYQFEEEKVSRWKKKKKTKKKKLSTKSAN